MNILFLTDSLGYAREGIQAKNLWTYRTAELFKHSNDRVFFDLKPYRDTSTLIDELDNHIKSYHPDIIFLQVGIVDAYPRSLSKNEFAVISRVPLLNKIVHSLIKRFYYHIVKMRNMTYVGKNQFKNNLKSLTNKFSKTKFLVIPIAPPNEEYIKKNPLIDENVSQYNNIFSEVFGDNFLNDLYLGADLEKLFMDDNHHLSELGHEHIFNFLVSHLTINGYLNEDANF